MISLPSLYQGVHSKSPELADLVGDLQSYFKGIGYAIAVDEDFGPKTKATVQQFQRDHKCSPFDGVVGPKTWGILLVNGFRPKSWEADAGGIESQDRDPTFPKKPGNMGSPNGLLLFGKGFTYTPKPLATMPGHVEPDSLWVQQNIGVADIPQLTPIKGSSHVSFNKRLIFQLETLFRVFEQLGLMSLVKTWNGGFVTRYLTGRTDKLSNHSFGSAFDINSQWNGFRTQPALVGEIGSVRLLVEIAFELGFYWGGWYNDGMHFEAYKIMTREEVLAAAARLLLKKGKVYVP